MYVVEYIYFQCSLNSAVFVASFNTSTALLDVSIESLFCLPFLLSYFANVHDSYSVFVL